MNHITDIEPLPPHTTLQMLLFFEDSEKLEHKEVIVVHFMSQV